MGNKGLYIPQNTQDLYQWEIKAYSTKYTRFVSMGNKGLYIPMGKIHKICINGK